MNASLQILLNCPEFARFVLRSQDFKINYNSEYKGVLTRELVKLLELQWNQEEKVIRPTSFKEKLGEIFDLFEGYYQHDACEFLSLLFEAIEHDTKGTNNAPDLLSGTEKIKKTSFFNKLFTGETQNITRCANNHAEERFEPFNCLSLSVQIPKKSKFVVHLFDFSQIFDSTSQGKGEFYQKIPVNSVKDNITFSILLRELGLKAKDSAEFSVFVMNKDQNLVNDRISIHLPQGGEILVYKSFTLAETNKHFSLEKEKAVKIRLVIEDSAEYSRNSRKIKTWFLIPLAKGEQYWKRGFERFIEKIAEKIEDSHFCLDGAKRELKKVYYPFDIKENSKVDFSGSEEVTIELSRTPTNIRNNTENRQLCNNLEEMLAFYSEYEFVENEFKCNKCKKRVNHSISSRISYVSDYIVIALIRFKIENGFTFN